MKKKKKNYLNTICLLSMLVAVGSSAPAMATNYDVNDKTDLINLFESTTLASEDTVTFLNPITIDDEISKYINNVTYTGSFTSSNLTIPQNAKLSINGGTQQLIVNELDGNNSAAGITVVSGETLNIHDVGEYNGEGAVKKSIHNYMGTNGGVIYNNGTVDIQNSIFKNKQATKGGAIYNTGSIGELNTDGTVKTYGIQNATFENNSATSGGAIHNNSENSSKKPLITLNNTNFTDNNATENGGAIYNYRDNTGSANISMTGGEFSNNQADKGGAIYNYSDGTTSGFAEITLENVDFSGNSATSNGGAIYNDNANSNTNYGSKITITNGAFDGNTATNGGAIYNNGTMYLKTTVGGKVEFVQESDSIYNASGAELNINPYGAGSVDLNSVLTNAGTVNFGGTNSISLVQESGTISGTINNAGQITLDDNPDIKSASISNTNNITFDAASGFKSGTIVGNNLTLTKSDDSTIIGTINGNMVTNLSTTDIQNVSINGNTLTITQENAGKTTYTYGNILGNQITLKPVDTSKDDIIGYVRQNQISFPATTEIVTSGSINNNTINLQAHGDITGGTVNVNSNTILDMTDGEIRDVLNTTLNIASGTTLTLNMDVNLFNATADKLLFTYSDSGNIVVQTINILQDITEKDTREEITINAYESSSLRDAISLATGNNLTLLLNDKSSTKYNVSYLNGSFIFKINPDTNSLKYYVSFHPDTERTYIMDETENVDQNLGDLNIDNSTLIIKMFGHDIKGNNETQRYQGINVLAG